MVRPRASSAPGTVATSSVKCGLCSNDRARRYVAAGFVSRPLVESLSEKIALDYLKLPIVVWVCLSQAKVRFVLHTKRTWCTTSIQPTRV